MSPRRNIFAAVFAALCFVSSVLAQDGVTEINCEDYTFPHDAFSQSDISKVYLSVDSVGASAFKDVGLTKYTTVFGVRVIAHKTVPDDKILHTANILAQMMDSDSDGTVDKPKAQQQLIDRYASMIIVADETFTNFLVSEEDGEGLPTELKFCPFSIDYEEMTKIQPGEAPEASCPEDLFEKDRSLAFVSDHLIGRSWPLFLSDDLETAEESPKYQKLQSLYDKAVAEKLFDVGNTGCPAEDLKTCGLVMFTSWAASTVLGVDRCYCEAVDAFKLCDKAMLAEKHPELSEFIKSEVLNNGSPDGMYAPADESVVVLENADPV